MLRRAVLLGLIALVAACSPQASDSLAGSGGSSSIVGGQGNSGGFASGGTAANGGSSPGSGGLLGSGGSAPIGGAAPEGGGSPIGGGSSAGGAASGGATAGGGAGIGGQEAVNAKTMAAEMGIGTNIGNTLENTTEWEVGWGQPLITEQFIQGLATRGIKSVRVPVAWDTYADAGVIDAAKTARVKEVVRWIVNAGMYAIVNIHWDGGWIFGEGTSDEFLLTSAVKTKFASYWQQIASAFADVGHQLILEGLNEEARFYLNGDSNGQPDYAALNELNQLFVTTVRAQAGFSATRALLIAGLVTDITLTCVDQFVVPSDPAGTGKLFLSLHYYTPYTFCGLDTVESWGSPATTWGTTAEQAELDTLFDKAGAFSESKQIPIILGEFGVTRGTAYPREPASRVRWMTSVAEACLSRNMVPVLWDTGSEISRTDGAFSAEFQEVMSNLD